MPTAEFLKLEVHHRPQRINHIHSMEPAIVQHHRCTIRQVRPSCSTSIRTHIPLAISSITLSNIILSNIILSSITLSSKVTQALSSSVIQSSILTWRTLKKT